VTCRMAAFLMTLDDPNCRNCFRLLLLVKAQPSYFTKYATNLRLIFRIDSPAGADDCCTIGSKNDRLRDVAMALIFVYLIHTFFVTVTNV